MIALIFNKIKIVIKYGLVVVLFCHCTNPILKKSENKIPTESPNTQAKFAPSINNSLFFKDMTHHYGLSEMSAELLYAVDLNNDSYTDLVYLPDTYSIPQFLFYNPKQGKFVQADYQPLDVILKAHYLLFYDFNRDGILDMLVGTFNKKNPIGEVPLFIYQGQIKNKKVFFKKYNSQIKLLPAPTTGVLVLDYNLDGHLDLFLSNWFYQEQNGEFLVKPDQLLQGKGFEFYDKSHLLENENIYNKSNKQFLNAKPTYGASICDIDDNGLVDILTVSSKGYENKLWINHHSKKNGEDFHFKNYAEESGYAQDPNGKTNSLEGGDNYFSSCIDYNNDGLMDIYIGAQNHEYDLDTRDKSVLLTGSQKKFPPFFLRTDIVHTEQNKWTQSDMRGNWVDLNMDGLIDLLIDNTGHPPSTRLVYFQQNADHSFDDKARENGLDLMNPNSTVILDVNKDGMPDILTAQSNRRAYHLPKRLYLMVNQQKPENRIFRLLPIGKRANTSGIGALIEFKTNKSTQKRIYQLSEGGFPAQNEPGLFFAEPRGEKLESIKIIWPIDSSKKKNIPIIREYILDNLTESKNYLIYLHEDGSWKQK